MIGWYSILHVCFFYRLTFLSVWFLSGRRQGSLSVYLWIYHWYELPGIIHRYSVYREKRKSHTVKWPIDFEIYSK